MRDGRTLLHQKGIYCLHLLTTIYNPALQTKEGITEQWLIPDKSINMKDITILIADDHNLVREAWRVVLNSEQKFRVIAEAGNAAQAIDLSKELRPNVVIMDINLPGLSGIDATPIIRKYSPGSKILAVSSHTQPAYVKRIMQKGALGYITKNSPKREMFEAITEVYSGNRYLCSESPNQGYIIRYF